jgi:hypothetical protein
MDEWKRGFNKLNMPRDVDFRSGGIKTVICTLS